MTDRLLDLTELGALREKLRYRMAIFAESRDRNLMETYDWLGRQLGIDGRVEVDDLSEDQIRFALRRIHPKRRKSEAPELSGDEFDEWLADHQGTREGFARMVGRDPRAVSGWSVVPKWAEVVMDILDSDPSFWCETFPRDYPGSSSDLKARLVADGISHGEFSWLTGASENTVSRWANKRPAPGWVDLVLKGIETGTIHAGQEKVWSNHDDDC